MIELSYRLSSEWAGGSSGIDPGSADETALRYKLFLGDLFFRIHGADFSAPWGWVPILDFAVSLHDILKELSEGAADSFYDFTESDERIYFGTRANSAVIVSCSYNEQQVSVPLARLVEAGKAFSRQIYDDLSAAHPKLLDNEFFMKWFPSPSVP